MSTKLQARESKDLSEATGLQTQIFQSTVPAVFPHLYMPERTLRISQLHPRKAESLQIQSSREKWMKDMMNFLQISRMMIPKCSWTNHHHHHHHHLQILTSQLRERT